MVLNWNIKIKLIILLIFKHVLSLICEICDFIQVIIEI